MHPAISGSELVIVTIPANYRYRGIMLFRFADGRMQLYGVKFAHLAIELRIPHFSLALN